MNENGQMRLELFTKEGKTYARAINDVKPRKEGPFKIISNAIAKTELQSLALVENSSSATSS